MSLVLPRDACVDRTDAVKKECEKTSAADPRWWCRSKKGIHGKCHEEGSFFQLQCGCLSICKGPQARRGDRGRNPVQRADGRPAPDSEAPPAEYVLNYPTGSPLWIPNL